MRDLQMRAPLPFIDNGLETTGSSPVVFHNVNCPLGENTALRALEILSAGLREFLPPRGFHRLIGVTAGLTLTEIFVFSRC